MYKDRITPDNITKLEDNQIFVFGANTSGRHGKGAAKTAMKWGAKYGQGEGIQGRTYGIPTKDSSIRNTLGLTTIARYIDRFIQYAKDNPNFIFLLTEIGCGLAGLTPKQVAPLFKGAIKVENIYLPKSFWRILQHEEKNIY